MPNIKSAKKRLRQNVVRRTRNRSFRTQVRNRCKNVIKSVREGDQQGAESRLLEAIQILDRAGSKKIIHKNAVARKKSRLSKMLKKMKDQAANAPS